MGLRSVIATFVMCILLDIIIPTGDIGGDIKLMIETLTFDLGDSLEMEGCKSCYLKTEKNVYYPEIDSSDTECNTCVFNPHSQCGSDMSYLKKMREFDSEKGTCSGNESFRITNRNKVEFDECDEVNDMCCITKTNEIKSKNPIQTLEPRKLINKCRVEILIVRYRAT